MADSRAEEWIKRSDAAFERLAPYHALCNDLAEIFYPERATFHCDEVVGDEGYRDLYDGHPILMRWRLGNAIGAMSRGRGREWFRSKVWPEYLNKRQAVAAWCEDATETQRAIVYDPRAQFSRQWGISDQDYVVFGSSPVKITENADRTGILNKTLHLKSAAPEENAEGVIDVTHERPKLTARVLGQMFNSTKQRRAMSKAMRDAVDKDPLAKIQIAQCVFPLADYEPSKGRPPKGATFVSLYIDPDTLTVLDEQYFWSFPYIWRRWLCAADHPMGLSPCALVALADSRMSQEIHRTLGEALQYAATPAKMVSAGAVEGNLDLAPDAVNFVKRDWDFRNGKPIQHIEQGTMPTMAAQFAKDKQVFIGQAWLTNLLTLPQDRDLTKYEASKLLEEDAREAAPIFEPMEADNATAMKRIRNIGERWRAFAPRPDEIKNAEVRDEFETPVSLAIARLMAEQAMQAVNAVASLGRLELDVGKTAAYRRTNFAELQRVVFEGIGRRSWLRDEKDAAADIENDETKAEIGELLQVGADTGLLDAALKGQLPGLSGGQPAPGGAPALPQPGQRPALPAPAGR